MDGSDIEIALLAASAGAAVVRAAYDARQRPSPDPTKEFVSQPDLEAERAILEVIATARPGDGRIGEETGRVDGTSSRRWLVDPLCGSENFTALTPLIAVNVALLDGTSELACVCADPIADEIYWADERGAFRRHAGVDSALTPSPHSRLVDINCDGPPDRSFLGPQLLTAATFRAAFKPRVMSTTLALAWVAAGRRAGYVTDGWFTDNVHFAAGIGLCRRAGCMVTNLAGGPVGERRGLLVAADSNTHTQLLECIRPHLGGVSA